MHVAADCDGCSNILHVRLVHEDLDGFFGYELDLRFGNLAEALQALDYCVDVCYLGRVQSIGH